MTIDIGGDDLTDAELAYLESGGRASEGLPAPSAPSEPMEQDAAPAPAQSQQQAPEAAAPDADDDDGDDDEAELIVGPDGKLRAKDGKFVSQKALHKERMKRKTIAAERDDLRVKLARGEERLAILNEAFSTNGDPRSEAAAQAIPKTAPNPLTEAPIDPESDFFGWAKQMQRQKDYLAQQYTQTSQETQARDQFKQVTDTYHADAKRFMAQEPNFEPAYRHLVSGRHRELEMLGMKDERQRNTYIAQEEAQIVVQCLQTGESPARVMYQLAQTRGFTPGAMQSQQNGNAQHQAPAAPQQRSQAQQKIEHLRNGQTAAQSLSNVAGGANEGLTLNRLASMSDEEFSRVVDGMSKKQVESLLGR